MNRTSVTLTGIVVTEPIPNPWDNNRVLMNVNTSDDIKDGDNIFTVEVDDKSSEVVSQYVTRGNRVNITGTLSNNLMGVRVKASSIKLLPRGN